MSRLLRSIINGIRGLLSFNANTANLNGTQYFRAGNDASLQLTSELTISAWVKPSEATSAKTILSKYESATGKRGFGLVMLASGIVEAFISHDGTTTPNILTSASYYTGDTLYHLVFTFDGTTLRLYKNGVETHTTASAGVIFNTPIEVVIGSYGGINLGVLPFDGSMGMVELHDQAISAGEVTALYNAGKARCYDDTSKTDMVGFWPLANWTGFTGQELLDQHGSNDLTNVGSTPFTGTGLTVECS